MMNVVRGQRRQLWFLNDPIEDNPDHSWDDYRTNWESTLVASLLWPEVCALRGDALARAGLPRQVSDGRGVAADALGRAAVAASRSRRPTPPSC